MKSRIIICVLALLALIAASCGSDAVNTATDIASDAADAVTNDDPAADDAEAMADDEAIADDAMADDGEDHSADEQAMTDDAMADDGEAMTDEEAAADDAIADDGDAMTDEEAATDDAIADEEAPADEALRIVSLSPTGTEMLFAIGAGDQVVAVDAFSYYPPEAPVTDLSGFEPNVEAIAGFEPDLVISSGPIEGLDAIEIENLVLNAATNLDDIYAQIEQLGALTGHVGEAAELVLSMQTDIEAALSAAPDRDIALTYYHELDNTLYSVTSATFIGYVYDLFGLENVADPADADGAAFGYPQLNEEFLITADPDIIFLADTLCCEVTAASAAARPGWDQLSAVQNGNIFELNDDIVSRWGPRIVDFIENVSAAVSELEPVAS